MSTVVEIRPATQADLPAILDLYGQPSLDNGEVLDAEAAQVIYARCMRYPDYQFYLAVLNDGEACQAVGTFALMVMDNLGHLGAKSAIVEAVAVDPAFQGMGVGKQMMQFARTMAAKKQCYKLVLSSNLKREAAHQFYDDLGFERHGYSFKLDC